MSVPHSRLPLTDDFDVDDEPESEASFFTPTPMLVQYYAGERTGLGYVATFPPETWMSSEWRLVPRPYSAYPINRGGSTRGDRGSRNIMERLGEFGSSLLHGTPRPPCKRMPWAHRTTPTVAKNSPTVCLAYACRMLTQVSSAPRMSSGLLRTHSSNFTTSTTSHCMRSAGNSTL